MSLFYVRDFLNHQAIPVEAINEQKTGASEKVNNGSH